MVLSVAMVYNLFPALSHHSFLRPVSLLSPLSWGTLAPSPLEVCTSSEGVSSRWRRNLSSEGVPWPERPPVEGVEVSELKKGQEEKWVDPVGRLLSDGALQVQVHLDVVVAQVHAELVQAFNHPGPVHAADGLRAERWDGGVPRAFLTCTWGTHLCHLLKDIFILRGTLL